MKSYGIYKFIINNKKTGTTRVVEHKNYITNIYRYFHSYDYFYSFINPSFSTTRYWSYNYPVLYVHLVLSGSNFNNPLTLEEPFYDKNIIGKSLTSDIDFKTLTMTSFTKSINTDGFLSIFTSGPVTGEYSFYACMAGYNSFSHIWSALNFPEITIADDEAMTLNYSILQRW